MGTQSFSFYTPILFQFVHKKSKLSALRKERHFGSVSKILDDGVALPLNNNIHFHSILIIDSIDGYVT